MNSAADILARGPVDLSQDRLLSRWEREGRLPYDRWGEKTDGGAPWIEWHDLKKLDYILAPAVFDVVLMTEFHNSDFIWFDLVRRS